MTEEYGKMRLVAPELPNEPGTGYTFSFGMIDGIQESFQKSGSTFPLVATSAENTIVIDTKTTKVITVSFTRKQPSPFNNSGSDSTKWSNAYWFQALTKCVNRWQCRVDGYRLTYVPSSDNPYIAPIDEKGYLRNISVRYVSGIPTKLKGSFEFHVGTMYVGSQAPSNKEVSRAQKDFQILISDENGAVPSIPLLGPGVNCVESYTIHGGPEVPFEYVTMKIPKKELKQIAPGLFENGKNGIVAGKNRLTISAVGMSSMTITKVKLSNDSYTISAYCDAERIRGCTLNSGGQLTPASWINRILTGGKYGFNFSGSSLVTNYDPVLSNQVGEIEFKKGTNIWYILQVCAMCVCARVFFADNKAFVIDYCKESGTYPEFMKDVDLHPLSGSALYAGATLGNVDLGDEGIDTVVNSVSISCSTPQIKDELYVRDEHGSIQYSAFNYYTYSDSGSEGVFKERAANTLYLSELKQNDPSNMPKIKEETPSTPPEEGSEEEEEETKGETQLFNQAKYFAQNYIAYRVEPQQTVEFTLKEMRMVNDTPTWMPYFGPASMVGRIHDDVNDVDVSNISDVDGSTPIYQKLALSAYSRSYPEGKSTYTWGVLSTIDLSSNTSQITTSLGNVK